MGRPSFLRDCLTHLRAQTVAPASIVVVDASADDQTYQMVANEFPEVRYLRNPLGPGTLSQSRQIGVSVGQADVVAFIDDDAFADPEWLHNLLDSFADPAVGGVGGRAVNDPPGSETADEAQIGRFRADGTLTGNFSADPGQVVDVDHLLGANMSFRRRAVEEIGGIHDGYPGTCLREDTDTSFRVTRAGWRLVFNPHAVVRHVAAPYVRGRRFDRRYAYFAERNHVVLLTRIFGPGNRYLLNYLQGASRSMAAELGRSVRAVGHLPTRERAASARAVAGGITRAAAMLAGLSAGLVAGRSERRRDHVLATKGQQG